MGRENYFEKQWIFRGFKVRHLRSLKRQAFRSRLGRAVRRFKEWVFKAGTIPNLEFGSLFRLLPPIPVLRPPSILFSF